MSALVTIQTLAESLMCLAGLSVFKSVALVVVATKCTTGGHLLPYV